MCDARCFDWNSPYFDFSCINCPEFERECRRNEALRKKNAEKRGRKR